MRTTILIALIVCGLASPLSAQEEPLAPRFTKGIGIKLQHPSDTLILNSFKCAEPGSFDDTYTFERRKRDERGIFLAIAGFFDDSPARKAGMACGDTIFAVNGREVTSVEELRKAINASTDDLVTVHLMRPDEVEKTEISKVRIKSWRELEIQTGKVTIDWVKELGKTLPITGYGGTYKDEFGPLITFGNEAVFHEVKTGQIKYQCSLRYLGAAPELHVESLYFHLLGPDTERLRIANGEAKVFTYEASVEREGIPKVVEIPIFVARQIDMDKTVGSTKKLGPVGVIGTGKRDDWYSWRRESIRCVFPEALVRAIEAKKKRFGYVVGK